MAYKILEYDPYLQPYAADIRLRMDNYAKKRFELVGRDGKLSDFANGHIFFGFHKTKEGWWYREWAPAAEEVYLRGRFFMIEYAHEVRQNEKQRKTKIQHVAKHLLYAALRLEVL